ncbi:MAG: SPASM domain-containing protein [Pleurocapsa sp.]
MKHPDIEKGINVYPISSLSIEDKQKALRAIDECIAILEKNQVFYVIAGDFIEIFRKDVQQSSRDAEANKQVSSLPLAEPTEKLVSEQSESNADIVDTNSPEQSNVSKPGIIEKCSQGMTRNCLDPWFYSQIKATGEVLPCCVHSPIGHCSESSDLDVVLNNDNITQLRNRLLHGDLDSECSMCVNKPLISVEEFKQKLIDQLDTNNQKNSELEKIGNQGENLLENTVFANSDLKSTDQSSQLNLSRTLFLSLKKAFLFTKQLVPQKVKTALNTQNLKYKYFDENLPADFEDAKYLELNPDVAKAGVNARVHYLSCGIEEQRPYK